MSATYYRFLIENLQAEQEDVLTSFLFEHGAAGISEKLDFSQSTEHYEPIFVDKAVKSVEVFFEKQPPLDLKENLLINYPALKISASEEEDKDWMSEWKKGFEAFALYKGIWLVPSWLQIPENAEDAILIDPGMAFGTGTHATTKLCAKLLHDFLDKNKIKNMIDVGCGTGILAILAAKRQQVEIDATEIDVDARECAIENTERNVPGRVNVLDLQVDKIDKVYDLLVANIIDGVLIQLKADFMRISKSGSHFILSGILDERRAHFAKEFLGSDFAIVEQEQMDEWWAYLVKRL